MEVTTTNKTNNEQDIQIDPDTLKQLLKMYVCLKISGKMFSGFMFFFMMFFPWILEIILVSRQTTENGIITLTVCGILQTIIATYGGFKMGISTQQLCSREEKDRYVIRDSMWCGHFADYKSMFSTGYPIYILPQWVITNIFSSWMYALHGSLPIYTHVFAYMPLIIYIALMTVTYVYSQEHDNIVISHNEYATVV